MNGNLNQNPQYIWLLSRRYCHKFVFAVKNRNSEISCANSKNENKECISSDQTRTQTHQAKLAGTTRHQQVKNHNLCADLQLVRKKVRLLRQVVLEEPSRWQTSKNFMKHIKTQICFAAYMICVKCESYPAVR